MRIVVSIRRPVLRRLNKGLKPLVQHYTDRFVVIGLLTVLLAVLALVGVALSLPANAQEQPLFATNTPVPPPPTPTPGPVAPEGYIEQYALRLWIEQDLLDVLVRYVQGLTPGDSNGMRAVDLIQYELRRRFPGAPRRSDQRERLLRAMLSAPPGSVDMRDAVRPYIQEALNQRNLAALSDYNGFNIDVVLVNLDGVDPVDAIIHTRYPAEAEDPADIRYEDYLLALASGGGSYSLLGPLSIFPAAPYGDIRGISLERFGDLNDDSLEEMAITLDSGDLNRQLLIFGWRNAAAINLIEPRREIHFGEVRAWVGDRVGLLNYRVESPAWGCLSEIPTEWAYTANFFRLAVDPASSVTYQNQDTLACRLYEAEPLFAQNPGDAIETVEDILSQSGRDEPGAEYALQRAQMVLAMLYALDGQPTRALDAAVELQASAEPESWLESQANAFVATLSQAGSTAVDVCSALMAASEYGACNVDDVLERQFADQPVLRDEPLLDQLEERGLHVLETTTVREIGRVDRQAFNFDLAGASWWTFAPLDRDHYTAERIDTPPGFESASTPEPLVEPPQTAYDALLGADDLTGALAVIGSAIRENPGVPLSPAARYLQALCYDLASDLSLAREVYYSLWVDHTSSLWGQLAAAHLERR